MPLPPNTAAVHVKRSKKHKDFWFVQGPGGVILSAGPRFDGDTGEATMTKQEIYKEFENIIMLDRHITNPEEYEVANTYLAPDNFEMLVKLDMRKKTLGEMKDKIIESTRG